MVGKSVLLAIFTLVAGFCIGLLCNFGFLAPGVTTLKAATTAPATIVFSNTIPPDHNTNLDSPAPTETPVLDTGNNTLLLDRANEAITALKNQDYAALSTFVHPTKGLVLTPYSTVDLDANLKFSSLQIATLANNNTKYIWGVTDGKGDPIEQTMSEYFARYVYNADFANAPIIGVDQVLGSGNALENVKEVFPEARFVEYYFPGLNPEYNGFDWCGLKLVFEVYRNEYRLTALIHSEWTI